MASLNIDFAAPVRRRRHPLGLLLLVVGAAALILAYAEWDDLEQRQAAAEARWRSLKRRAGTAASVPPAPVAGEALARLGAPWRSLLAELEGLDALPAALLDAEADARQRRLRLVAEARTLDDALAVVERLKRSRRFDEVALLSHERQKVGAAEVIGFTIQASWAEAGVSRQ